MRRAVGMIAMGLVVTVAGVLMLVGYHAQSPYDRAGFTLLLAWAAIGGGSLVTLVGTIAAGVRLALDDEGA